MYSYYYSKLYVITYNYNYIQLNYINIIYIYILTKYTYACILRALIT